MNMIPVSSSNIVSIGYDSDRAQLWVQFRIGLYVYHGVPQSAFDAFLRAASKGTYHSDYIKDVYRYSRIG